MTQHVKEAVEVGRRGLQILNGIAKVENHLPEPGFKEEELTQEEKDRAWGALGTLNKIADELFANNQKLKQIHAKIESEKSEGEGEKEEAKKETRESKK